METDYTNLEDTVEFAQFLANEFRVPVFVIKYPNRDNYNISLNGKKNAKTGAITIWASNSAQN